ncbi:hypothetical protein MPLDJ20_140106 [Mesorhizobium plurifarium]|uniref:Uncharacterized protein n=1 Tax=Mesorhizobium plurifarium TaxID=69974 RepID=A0A090GH76_MESPL|nr:hypothetical protein MPLDJ20_140106 [Mesorhizobium plurifarium]
MPLSNLIRERIRRSSNRSPGQREVHWMSSETDVAAANGCATASCGCRAGLGHRVIGIPWGHIEKSHKIYYGTKMLGTDQGIATNSTYQPNARTAGVAPTEQLLLSF